MASPFAWAPKSPDRVFVPDTGAHRGGNNPADAPPQFCPSGAPFEMSRFLIIGVGTPLSPAPEKFPLRDGHRSDAVRDVELGEQATQLRLDCVLAEKQVSA